MFLTNHMTGFQIFYIIFKYQWYFRSFGIVKNLNRLDRDVFGIVMWMGRLLPPTKIRIFMSLQPPTDFISNRKHYESLVTRFRSRTSVRSKNIAIFITHLNHVLHILRSLIPKFIFILIKIFYSFIISRRNFLVIEILKVTFSETRNGLEWLGEEWDLGRSARWQSNIAIVSVSLSQSECIIAKDSNQERKRHWKFHQRSLKVKIPNFNVDYESGKCWWGIIETFYKKFKAKYSC